MKALSEDKLESVNACMFEKLMTSIIESKDPNKVDILYYLIESGIPIQFSSGCTAAYVAGMQTNHEEQYEMLLLLKYTNETLFEYKCGPLYESTWDVLQRKNPALYKAIKYGDYMNIIST